MVSEQIKPTVSFGELRSLVQDPAYTGDYPEPHEADFEAAEAYLREHLARVQAPVKYSAPYRHYKGDWQEYLLEKPSFLIWYPRAYWLSPVQTGREDVLRLLHATLLSEMLWLYSRHQHGYFFAHAYNSREAAFIAKKAS